MDKTCDLCFEDLEAKPCWDLECKHRFHVACIIRRFRTVNSGACPVCQAVESSDPLPVEERARFVTIKRQWQQHVDIVEKEVKAQLERIHKAKTKCTQWAQEHQKRTDDLATKETEFAQRCVLLEKQDSDLRAREQEVEEMQQTARQLQQHAVKLEEETRKKYHTVRKEEQCISGMREELQKKLVECNTLVAVAERERQEMIRARNTYNEEFQEAHAARLATEAELQRLKMSEPQIGAWPVQRRYPKGSCRFCGYESMHPSRKQCVACENRYLAARKDFRSPRERLVDNLVNILRVNGTPDLQSSAVSGMPDSTLNFIWQLVS